MQKDEWETTITYDQMDQVVSIYSTVPKHIRKLRSDERFRVWRDGGDWIHGSINAADFNVLGGFKRKSKPMSEEQRAAAVARLAAARAKKGAGE